MRVYIYVIVLLLLLVNIISSLSVENKNEILKKVAESFTNNMDKQAFLDDLSPTPEMHAVEMEKNNQAVLKMYDQIVAEGNNKNVEESTAEESTEEENKDVPSLVEVESELKRSVAAAQLEDKATEQVDVMDDEKNALEQSENMSTSDNLNTASMAEIKDQVHSQSKAKTNRWNILYTTAKKMGKALGIKLSKDAKARKKENPMAQAVEDCMGCRFIWHQVEMDVANARYIEDTQASFEHNCLDAQKTEIFFKVCEDMYDDMYAMADDYMTNSWSVEEMCQRAGLCYNGKKKRK